MYHISEEALVEIRAAMKKVKDVKAYKRLQAVELRGAGRKNGEIGAITGFHEDMVGKFARRYIEDGIEGLLEDRRVGGNNRNMSDEEAKEFLTKFEESALKGEIVTVSEISAAYDEATGHERGSKSTVYNFLHRYGWRLVAPHPKHPGKASDEEIEASKKK